MLFMCVLIVDLVCWYWMWI